MPPQKIGLVAELDLSKFSRNVTTYFNSINKMQQATESLAAAVSSSFRTIATNITSSTSQSAAQMLHLRTQTQQLHNLLRNTANLTGYVNQLRALSQAANQAASSLSRVSSASRGARSINIGGIGGIGAGLGSLAGGIGGGIGSVLSGVAGIGGAISSLAGNIGRTVSSILGSVTSLAGGIVRAFSSIIGSVAGVIRAFVSLGSSILGAVGSVIRSVSSLVSGVVRAFAGMVSSVLRIVGSLVTTIGIAFNTILRTVLGIIGSLVSGVVNAFTSLLGSVVNIAQSIVGGVVRAFGSLVGAVFNAVSGLAGSVIGIFSGILRSVSNIVSSLASTVVGIFSSIAKSVLNIVGNMVKGVVNQLTNLVKKTVDILKSVASNILDAYRDLGGKLVQIITVATAAVTGALILIGRKTANWLSDAVQGAADFEQNMADIASVLRKTRAEITPLADEITKLGLDPQLVVSTNEASQVIEQLARNGLEMTQILDGAAEAAILLANATGGDFATGADVATMAMQMFGLAASEIGRIADVSQGVINNSRIDLEDWALALGNGGAAAASFGVEFEDFATIITGTVNLFHSARQAGTGLMTFFQRLVPTTETAADAFRSVGLYAGLSTAEFEGLAEEVAETEKRIADLDPRLVHYDELIQAHTDHLNELKTQMIPGKNKFFDDAGNFIGTKEMVLELTKAVMDLNELDLADFGQRAFGRDALETFIGIVQMGKNELAGLEGGFSDINAEISIQNSAAEAAATRTKTLAARWKNLGDIWETIQRQSGGKFNDMLLNLVNRMTKLTNLNQDRVVSFFGRLAELLNKLVDAALPWVEKMLPGIIDNMEALASWLVETVLQGDKAQDWFERMSPGLRNFMERVFGVVRSVKEFAGQVLDLVGSLSKTFRPFIEFMLQNVELKDVLIAAAGAIMFNIVPGILRLVGVSLLAVKAVSSIRRGWEEDWGGIRSFFEQTWPRIRQPLIDFINNILTGKWKDAWDQAVGFVRTALIELEKAVPPFFKTFVNLISDVLHGDWEGAWDNVVKIAVKSFDLIKQFLKGLETPFSDFITNVLEGNWPKVWSKIVETAQKSFILITQMLKALETPFTDFIVDVLEGSWKRVWGKIVLSTQIALDKVIEILYGFDIPFTDFLANVLAGKWSIVWEQMKNTASIAYDWVVAELYKMDTPFTGFLSNVLSGKWSAAWLQMQNLVVGILEEIKKYVPGWAESFITLLQQVVTGDWQGAWDTAKGIATGVFDAITAWLSDRGPWGRFLSEIIQGDWKGAWDEAKGIIFGEGGILPKIHEWLIDRGPWGVFVSDILKGDFTKAWEDLKDLIFGPEGIVTKILYWLEDTGPWGKFAADVLRGDFKTAWDELKTLIGLTDEKINAIKDTLYIMVGAFAIATATMIAFNLRGIATVVAGIAVLGFSLIGFIPLVAAIGVAVAALRVAWEEDFLGIRAFTVEVLKGIGTAFQVGLLLVGNLVDIFLLVLKEDWAGAWKEIQDIAAFAWQFVARAALAGLTLIESFMLEGPGVNIINWLTSTFPTTLVGLETIFTNTSSLISTAWATLTQNLLDSQGSWGGFFAFIESTVGIAAQRIGNFIGFVDGVMQFFNAQMQASQDAVKGMDLIGKRALAESQGDTAGVAALDLEIGQHNLETAANRHAADPLTFIQQRQQAIMDAFDVNQQEIRNKAKSSGESFIDTILEVTAAGKKKLQESIIPGFLDEETLRNRFGLQAGLVKDLFDSIASGVGGQASWADILREPVDPSDLSMLKGQFSNIFSQFTFPESIGGIDPTRPTSVFNSIFDAIKQLGIDLTGDFLNRGTEAMNNLGAGATAEQTSVVSIFQGIMAQISATANTMIESFKNLGINIGGSLKTGLEETLEMNSPSKVFMRMGAYAAEGFKTGWLSTMGESLLGDSMAANKLRFAISRAGTAAAMAGSRTSDFRNSLSTPNYSYATTNSPVQIGPNYINTPFDKAEFEYRVEQIVRGMKS